LYTRGVAGLIQENPDPEQESDMSSAPLPPEKQAEVDDLARAIQQAVDAEVNELATELAATDDADLFGANEFKVRALAHKIAAKALERRLAGKKTDTTGPA
jgi:hypothetical protein